METMYDSTGIEEKWYQFWLDNKLFKSTPDDREAYTLVVPPPNVTGILHMGHVLNNTIQDSLARRARMKGYNVCWVPGTDHASIATESKVVNMLREKGIQKSSISRDEFLGYAWEWKEKYGGIILDQLKKLGASCDWDRTAFTMDEIRYKAVIKVFVDLYNKGKIYRGYRMSNWDPVAKTVLSDHDVIHREHQSKLYYIRYRIEGSDDFLTIATTRPETIFADTAVCLNSKDERAAALKGRKVLIPLIGRSIPVIFDDYVDPSFGSGVLKVTPAHDFNDYELANRHKLEVIDIFDESGKLNEKAVLYVGEDRFAARAKVVEELTAQGQMEKTEDITSNVGFSERTNVIIEPRLTLQWYLNTSQMAAIALDAVLTKEIEFFPPQYINTYRQWMENIHDWCISRQLWWGHRIPVYYLDADNYFAAETIEDAVAQAKAKTGRDDLTAADLAQDEDVLDTWFSSWLWPMSVFDGFSEDGDKSELEYYYPVNTLVTGWDIIFKWVAHMIMAGYEYAGARPFKRVLFHGMVRDKQGRKMSKSLGNSPNPLDLIKDYGADATRFGILLCSPGISGDMLFDEAMCNQGRKFTNKLWNALKLVKGWEPEDSESEDNAAVTSWFEQKLNEKMLEIDDLFEKFRMSEAMKAAYILAWDDFCSSYLELVKPSRETKKMDRATYEKTIFYFEYILKLLHPFVPFITEEIYYQLKDGQGDYTSISTLPYPAAVAVDAHALKAGDLAIDLISKIRGLRNANQIKFQTALTLHIQTATPELYSGFLSKVRKNANIDAVHFSTPGAQAVQGLSFIIGADQFVLETEEVVDKEIEKKSLASEYSHLLAFKQSLETKLNDEKFISKAPEAVVNKEKKKLEDTISKLQRIQAIVEAK